MELGLYQLRDVPGSGRWVETPLAAQFRSYVAHPRDRIGEVLVAGRAPEEIAG